MKEQIIDEHDRHHHSHGCTAYSKACHGELFDRIVANKAENTNASKG